MVAGLLGDFPIHIFTPEGKGPCPVMVYYHGGGLVIANTKVDEASPCALAKMAKAVTVAVDYHQAPEPKFPAAPNDAYAAYTWVLKNAQTINGDPARDTAIAVRCRLPVAGVGEFGSRPVRSNARQRIVLRSTPVSRAACRSSTVLGVKVYTTPMTAPLM
ncbi:MAG: alpha/beta hydrolase fold domain-containing protein [Telluria sp.]